MTLLQQGSTSQNVSRTTEGSTQLQKLHCRGFNVSVHSDNSTSGTGRTWTWTSQLSTNHLCLFIYLYKITLFSRLGWPMISASHCASDHGLALFREAPSPTQIAGHVHWSYGYLRCTTSAELKIRGQTIKWDLDGSTWFAKNYLDKPSVQNLNRFRITTENSQHNFWL